MTTLATTHLYFEALDQSIWGPGKSKTLSIDTGKSGVLETSNNLPIDIGGSFLGFEGVLAVSLQFGLKAYAEISAGSFDAALGINLTVEHTTGVDTTRPGDIVFDFSRWSYGVAKVNTGDVAIGGKAGLKLVLGVKAGLTDMSYSVFYTEKSIADLTIVDYYEEIDLISISSSAVKVEVDPFAKFPLLKDIFTISLALPSGAEIKAAPTYGTGRVETAGVSDDAFLALNADLDQFVTRLLTSFPATAPLGKFLENTIFLSVQYDLHDIAPFIDAGNVYFELTIVDVTATLGAFIGQTLAIDATPTGSSRPDIGITLRSDNGTPGYFLDDAVRTGVLGGTPIVLPKPAMGTGDGFVEVTAYYDLRNVSFTHSIGIQFGLQFNIQVLKGELGGDIVNLLGLGFSIGPLIDEDFPEDLIAIGPRIPIASNTYVMPGGSFVGAVDGTNPANWIHIDGAFGASGLKDAAGNPLTGQALERTYQVFYTDFAPPDWNPDAPGAQQQAADFRILFAKNVAITIAAFSELWQATSPNQVIVERPIGVVNEIVNHTTYLWSGNDDTYVRMGNPSSDAYNFVAINPISAPLSRLRAQADYLSSFPYLDRPVAFDSTDEAKLDLLHDLGADRWSPSEHVLRYFYGTGTAQRYVMSNIPVEVIGQGMGDVLVYTGVNDGGAHGRLFDGGGQTGNEYDIFFADFSVYDYYIPITWDLSAAQNGVGVNVMSGPYGADYPVTVKNIEAIWIITGDIDDNIVTYRYGDRVETRGGDDFVTNFADTAPDVIDTGAHDDMVMTKFEQHATPLAASFVDTISGGTGFDLVTHRQTTSQGLRIDLRVNAEFAFGVRDVGAGPLIGVGADSSMADLLTLAQVHTASFAPNPQRDGAGGAGDAVFFINHTFQQGAIQFSADFEGIGVFGSDIANDLVLFSGGLVYTGGTGAASTADTLVANFHAYQSGMGALQGLNLRVGGAAAGFGGAYIEGFERLVVIGSGFADYFQGGVFADLVSGEGGDDFVDGGADTVRDVLLGGTGSDHFFWANDGADVIRGDTGYHGNGIATDVDTLVIAADGTEQHGLYVDFHTLVGLPGAIGGNAGGDVDYAATGEYLSDFRSFAQLLIAMELTGDAESGDFYAPYARAVTFAGTPPTNADFMTYSGIEQVDIIGSTNHSDLIIYQNGANYVGGEAPSGLDQDVFVADFRAQSIGVNFRIRDTDANGDPVADSEGQILENGVAVSGMDRAVMRAGSGDDTLVGGRLNDYFAGGGGNDVLVGGAGRNELHGETGDDFVYWFGVGDDTATGGEGFDNLVVSGGAGALGLRFLYDGGNADTQLMSAANNNFYLRILLGALADPVEQWRNTVGTVLALNDHNAQLSSYVPLHAILASGFESVNVFGDAAFDDLVVYQGGVAYKGGERAGDADVFVANFGDQTQPLSIDVDLLGADANSAFHDIGNGVYIGGFERLALVLGSGDDRASGGMFNDLLVGGSGADKLGAGGGGFDELDGGPGDDILYVGGNSGIFDGGEGRDTVNIAGFDTSLRVTLFGEAFNGVEIGAAQTANRSSLTTLFEVTLPALAHTYYGIPGAGQSLILESIEEVNITAGAGADLLIAGPSAGHLFGGAGDDVLVSRAGNDVLVGGAGLDSYAFDVGMGDDVIGGESAGGAVLYFVHHARADLGFVAEGNDLRIDALGGSVTVVGYFVGGGNGLELVFDTADFHGTIDLSGLQAPGGGSHVAGITVNGTSLANQMPSPGNGDDTMFGLDGVDYLQGGPGADILDGGASEDLASYTASVAGITVDLMTGRGFHGDAEGDILLNIENVSGAEGGNWLGGDAQANMLMGGKSADTLLGRGGNDMLVAGAGNDTVHGGTGDDALFGYAGNDELHGDEDADVLMGGDGNDTLQGGSGPDTMAGGNGTDSLAGDAGDDMMLYGTDAANQDWRVAGVGDFQGDGKADILWRNATTGQVRVYHSGNVATSAALTTVTDLNWKVVGVGDFDGDGKSDVLWRNGMTGANAIWKSASSTTQQAVSTEANQAWQVAGVGDFQGDGKADILWRNGTTGQNYLYNSGNAATGGFLTTQADLNWKIVGIGDFNGDTKADILWRDTSTGDNTIWSSGSSATQQPVLAEADQSWQVAGVGDFNADGKSDILWRNANSGQNILYYSANAATAGIISTLADLNWQVQPMPLSAPKGSAASDFDGDGKSDILFRNAQTGANTIWRSGNSTTLLYGGTAAAAGGIFDSGITTFAGGADVDSANFAAFGAAILGDLRLTTGSVQTRDGASLAPGIGPLRTLAQLSAVENLAGSAFDDTLIGDAVANALMGGVGDDILKGGPGADFLVGGDGLDTADYGADVGPSGGIAVDLRLALQTVIDSWGDTDRISSIEVFIGTASADVFMLDDLANAVNGGGGADLASGAGGDDVLGGGDGADTLIGGAGDDLLQGDGSDDLLQGDAGDDQLIGGLGNDTLEGGIGRDALAGGAGDDLFDGGDDADYASYALAAAAVIVNLKTGRASGGDGSDTLISIEDVYGSSFADTLVGDDRTSGQGGNRLSGGLGNDALRGGGGDDTLDGGMGDDVLDGGSDSDYVSYGFATAGVTVNLLLQSASGADGNDLLTSIENASGGAHGDLLIGSGSRNALEGQGGNDTLNAGAGNDWLLGGAGNDLLDGDGGNDMAVYNGLRSDYVIASTLTGFTITSVDDGVDTLSNIELAWFTDQTVTLVNTAVPDTVSPLVADFSPAADTINVPRTSDVVVTFSEVVRLGSGSIKLLSPNGNAFAEYDVKGDPASFMNSFNKLSLSGNQLTINPGAELSPGQQYRLQFSAGSIQDYSGNGFAGAATYSFTTVGDYVLGDSNNNNNLFGTDADDTIDGKSNSDTMTGKKGDDLYYADRLTDVVVELPGEGNDTIVWQGSAAYTLEAFPNVENLTLAGNDHPNQAGTGNDAANRMQGSVGNNAMSGGAGNDTLIGGLGDDTLDGGSGIDTAVIAGLRQDYSITRGAGGTTVVGADGTDLLIGIEKIAFDYEVVQFRQADSDFDGDGKSDVIFRNSLTGANTIWKSGNSATQQAVATEPNQAWKVAGVGDFQGDGKSDILWRNSSTGQNYLYNSGNLATGTSLGTVADLNWKVVGIGDFDGDAKSDILWRNSSTGANTIWKSGNSATQQAVMTEASQAWQVAGVGDFQGDGKSDILWRNSSTGQNYLYNSGNAATGAFLTSLADLNWKVVGIGDFDGDGKSDILWRNSSSGANTIWKSGNSATQQAVATETNQAWKVVAVGDYQGDGKSDILWRNSTTGQNYLYNAGNAATGGFLGPVADLNWAVQPASAPTATPSAAPKRVAGDFDGDGKSDILWRNTTTGADTIWKSGNSATQQAVATETNQAWQVAGIGDFQGDGKADILWRNTSTGQNYLYNSGNVATGTSLSTQADQNWKIVGVGDFDGDGKSDILWRNASTGADTIWKSGNSATQQAVATEANQAWQVAGVGDFQGDGKSDILWRNSSTGQNYLYNSGNLATGTSLSTQADQNWKIVGVGDFDGDGKSDILWRNTSTGANTIWKSGNSATVQAVSTEANQTWQIVGVGDFQGDGKSDILWRNSGTGQTYLYNSGNSATGGFLTTQADQNWRVIDGLETGDLLAGGAGANRLFGTVRSDVLYGAAGADTATGGPGADLFRYLASTEGADSITDFTPGVDKIQVVSAGFASVPIGALAADRFVAGTAPVASQAASQFLYTTSTGVLSFDADGTGTGAAIQIVTLVGQPALTVADLVAIGA